MHLIRASISKGLGRIVGMAINVQLMSVCVWTRAGGRWALCWNSLSPPTTAPHGPSAVREGLLGGELALWQRPVSELVVVTGLCHVRALPAAAEWMQSTRFTLTIHFSQDVKFSS